MTRLSSSGSSSSMDEKTSKALTAMLQDHDEDSIIFESFLPHIRSSITHEADPPSKKMKVLISKEAPGKDAPPMATPMKMTPPEAPRGEGSSKQRDKVVS
ncbi:hypothetical protein BHE74_00001685 [Ensete ventricosum]|nr:hypothetical protein GW17_00023465 [Ensete ventricosum]RWW89376.1 hypothetical protein BHE74_00001685 [Ensete ventricosum]